MRVTPGPVPIDVITGGQHHKNKMSRLVGLKEFYASSEAQGAGVSMMIYPSGEPTIYALTKRRHDLKAALRTIEHSVLQLEAGYHFDDEIAGQKIASMRRALTVITRDAELLMSLLEVD